MMYILCEIGIGIGYQNLSYGKFKTGETHFMVCFFLFFFCFPENLSCKYDIQIAKIFLRDT